MGLGRCSLGACLSTAVLNKWLVEGAQWTALLLVCWPVFQSCIVNCCNSVTHTLPVNGPFPGPPRWTGTRKAIWILLKQETVSGSGISWAICKSAPRSRQITTPTPHHSVFYRPDVLPATQPTASKHWSHKLLLNAVRQNNIILCKTS